ncbi:MAG: Transcriptional regulator containing HTH domain [Candidatus Methanohalarchaeum thermophilum]|uniref:Transcriptional regulator containing HTH domain n=1 Tax=Methanohalarchaeum thermophilum TaxID=1903181 RepID=A0A1Q6DY17_METT1|nr:MAG: Transcriptional regulator containing HTH domain [Candidatus Methanohalarchaeum thermophilum]
MMGKKRGRWKIILDLLESIAENGECNKTEAMRGAKLDWRNFKKYHKFLEKNNYIKITEQENLKVTQEGKKLLKDLKKVNKKL